MRAWLTGGGNRHLSVPRGTVGVVAERLDLGTRGGEWDWMWTRERAPGGARRGPRRAASTRPTATRPRRSSPRTARARTASPSPARASAGSACGSPPPETLLAVGGSEPCQGGTPTLAGIAVATDRRGQGWGAAVTAHLTRRAVAETGACALGMFADNDVARRVYHRLGFTTGMEWTSRWFG